MPGRITELSESQIIADILREQRRLRSHVAAQFPLWTHDIFTAPATYQLTSIPYGINALADNGLVLSEGTDYTVDYTTGLITFTVGRTAGHVIFVSYVTTGDLTALSGPVDVGFVGDPSGWAIVSNQAKAMSVAYSSAYLISPTTYNTVQVTIQSAAGVNAPEIAAAYNPTSGDWCGIDVAGLCTLAIRTPAGNSFVSLLGGGGPSFPSRWTVSYNSSGQLGVTYETLVGGVWTVQASQVLNATAGQRTYLDGLQDVMIRSGQNTLFDDLSCGSITDSFNRADQTGLGTTDTGQNWNYNP